MTQRDRQRISAGLAERVSYAEIARRLDRPTSTISREINRNGGPSGYRPELAHRATERRARRGTPASQSAAGVPDGSVPEIPDEAVAITVKMGLPKMMARVLLCLMLTDEGRLTAAELVRGLKISPASVSTAIGYLTGQGLVRRERDPRRRRDIYVIDDDVWYSSLVKGSQRTREAAVIMKEAAETFGLDTPVGRRLLASGAFLELISLDTLASADRWRGLLP